MRMRNAAVLVMAMATIAAAALLDTLVIDHVERPDEN